MPSVKRFKTKYPGVLYIEGTSPITGKPERIYYIRYRRDGKLTEEKAGRQVQDNMTPAKAAAMRGERIRGHEASNQERRVEARTALEIEAQRWTFDRLWAEYKRQRPDLKGLVTDENRYQLHLRPAFGGKEPSELVPLDIDRVRLKLAKGHQPATVRNAIELLRRIINFGLRKHLCQAPVFKIEMPKVNNLKTEDLDHSQLTALLKTAGEDTHPCAGKMMLLALYSGMRRGEMFHLQWQHLDFERGFIALVDPKGGQDQRIPMNDAARELLLSLPNTSDYVFPGRGGGQRTDINKALTRIKAKAGLPRDFRALHGLRHCYASMLASSGQVDLLTLQKLLTHKSPHMVLRYAHLRDHALRQASNLAGEIVGQAADKEAAFKN
jgi:integrase